MQTINEMIQRAEEDGFEGDHAEAKVCQDIVLKALAESPMNRNATVKGGVVMRSITHNVRRATLDMDIDFIRYSLSDESILQFIRRLDCLENIHIRQVGMITELKQQEYHGKRVFVEISDSSGDSIRSKIDLGVHKNLSVELEEYCFDIAFDDEGASLLINSKEQMFTEKLRSLLKFGTSSTRFKDIFDMCWLIDLVDQKKLKTCLDIFIFDDQKMRENNMPDILRRVKRTFSSDKYRSRLAGSRKNWLDIDAASVLEKLIRFLESL